MSVNIKFCGAAGVVTGSSYLVTVPQGQFLIDCGLFQGTKTVRELNYGDFGFDPAKVSFVLLTHAHIDHSGLLPKLYKQGFTGKIHTTAPTRDLLEYMLPDSAYIQETEVRRLNNKNRQRGIAEVEPIYTYEDVTTCLENISPVKINGWIDMPLGVKARFWNAGHILGSASIELQLPSADGKPVHIVFSGDLGPDNKLFHDDPEAPKNIDYVVVESTYGDRERLDHSIATRRAVLKREILEATSYKGNILIPSFAVERTQELLFDLDWLMEHSQLPELPLFIDSPLATKVTGVFEKYRSELEETVGKGNNPFRGRNIRYVESAEESKSLNRIKSGAIIMAASGMCEAGRIRYHLKNNLWNKNTTVLFVGYQAEGTLGRFLQQGVERVRIHGQEIDVHARIRTIEGYSAHADQSELVAWVKARLPVAKNIFLTHGIDSARAAFTEKLMQAGIAPNLMLTPNIDDIYRLDERSAKKLADGKPRLIAEEISAPLDWHNDYAQFVLKLSRHLRDMKDNRARHSLLAELTGRILSSKAESQDSPRRQNAKK